jgi:NAD-specific glutamate dehydrogenase
VSQLDQITMHDLLTSVLLSENYALASTQALKNKDIPEGGAKGVILPESVASGDKEQRTC